MDGANLFHEMKCLVADQVFVAFSAVTAVDSGKKALELLGLVSVVGLLVLPFLVVSTILMRRFLVAGAKRQHDHHRLLDAGDDRV